MTIELATLISVVSITLAVATFIIARKKDTKSDVEAETARIEPIKENLITLGLKIDMINNTTTETRNDIKSMQRTVTDHDKRITIVERDVQTAFKRIDELKENVNENNK